MAASKGCRKLFSQISILSILHAVVPREISHAYATFFLWGKGGGGYKQSVLREIRSVFLFVSSITKQQFNKYTTDQ